MFKIIVIGHYGACSLTAHSHGSFIIRGSLTVVLLFDFISYLPVPIYFYCVYARIQHLNLRTYWGRGGGVASTSPPHKVFLGFLLEDKTSVPDFFSSYSFIPREHFKTNLVIVAMVTRYDVISSRW